MMSTEIFQSKSPAKIGDVAKSAGVSKTTVSRYLSGNFNALSDETRLKIQSAIATLHYSPNQFARGLRGGRSNLIGVILADISNPFSTAMLRGVEDIAKSNGYSVVVWNTDNDVQRERSYILLAQAHQVDGLLINTTGQNNEFLCSLNLQNTPIVLVDRKVPDLNFDTVCVDNESSTKTALYYLLEKGYERVALFTEPILGISSRSERLGIFTHLMTINHHVSLNDVYEVDASDQTQLQEALLEFLYASRGQLRAVFAGNGVMMLKLSLIFQKLNIRIPEDLSCLAFDDPEWAPLVGTGITAISQPTYDIGVVATQRIMKHLQSQDRLPAELIELPARFIIRGSAPGSLTTTRGS